MLLEEFLRQILFNFFAINRKFFTYVRIHACLRCEDIIFKKVQNYRKIVLIKNTVENGWCEGNAPPRVITYTVIQKLSANEL